MTQQTQNDKNEWPEWAWVSRHAENSKFDSLTMTGPGSSHSFPYNRPTHYCNRNWGPQDYINYRLEMLREMAEDVQKLIELFDMNSISEDADWNRGIQAARSVRPRDVSKQISYANGSRVGEKAEINDL